MHLGDQVGRPDHQLGRRAAPERALAADQRLVDADDVQARLGELARGVLTARPDAEHHHVTVSCRLRRAHGATQSPGTRWAGEPPVPTRRARRRPGRRRRRCWPAATPTTSPRATPHQLPALRIAHGERAALPTSTRRTGTRCRRSSCSTRRWRSSRRSSCRRTPRLLDAAISRLPRRSRRRHGGARCSPASTARRRCAAPPRPTTAAPRSSTRSPTAPPWGSGSCTAASTSAPATRCSRRLTTSTRPRTACACSASAPARASSGSGCTTTRRRPPWTRWSSALARGITPRTKVVALTWVHSSTGVRVPVAEICAALEGLSKVPSQPVRRLRRRRARVQRRRRGPARPRLRLPLARAPTSGCSGRAAPASCGAAASDR